MNGVHDMGGMHGFGPMLPEANEPVFHAPWEGRVRGMFVLMGAWRRWNIDASRHAIERLPPADYLRYSYFEKWFDALVALTLNAGIITAEELASGHKTAGTAVAAPPVTADYGHERHHGDGIVPAEGCGQPALRRRRSGARPEYQS